MTTTHLPASITELNGTYVLDGSHSQLGFIARHAMVTKVRGAFNGVSGTATIDGSNPAASSLNVTVETATVDTRSEQRDGHLKSADFFDAAAYPTMEFKSTGLKKAGKNAYKMAGNLTLHGVSKPVTMNLIYTGTTQNPMSKKTTVGFRVTGTIKRSEFNIGEKFPEPMISDEVRIKADGEFAQ